MEHYLYDVMKKKSGMKFKMRPEQRGRQGEVVNGNSKHSGTNESK